MPLIETTTMILAGLSAAIVLIVVALVARVARAGLGLTDRISHLESGVEASTMVFDERTSKRIQLTDAMTERSDRLVERQESVTSSVGELSFLAGEVARARDKARSDLMTAILGDSNDVARARERARGTSSGDSRPAGAPPVSSDGGP